MGSLEWDFLYLMPHVAFDESVESEFLALVKGSDTRLSEIAAAYPAVQRLLKNMRGQFGESIRPGALLIRADAPSAVDYPAVAAFRNVVAMSSMIDAWINQLAGGNGLSPWWSDFFDFYPITATSDGNDLIGRSAAVLSMHSPDKFSGQKAAHLPDTQMFTFALDRTVFEGCMQVWSRKYIRRRRERLSTKLFRSLEVAYHAMRLPSIGKRDISIHDVGVGVGLWVSALEIISRPDTGDVNRGHVMTLLSQFKWDTSSLRANRFQVSNRSGMPMRDSVGTIRKFNFIQKLYAELYRARNDFLHGNPVNISKLFRRGATGGPSLLQCGPLIYRAALIAFLQLRQDEELEQYALRRPFERRYEEAVESCRAS